MEIMKMQVTETQVHDSALLDYSSLELGDKKNSVAVLRSGELRSGANGPYIVFNFADVSGTLVIGRYFGNSREILSKDWTSLRGRVCTLSYEVSQFNGRVGITVTNILPMEREHSDIVKKEGFHLQDPQMDNAILSIKETISELKTEELKVAILSLVDSLSVNLYLRGGNPDFLRGRLGGNAIFTDYLMKAVKNLPSSLNVNDELKASLYATLLIVETAIFLQREDSPEAVILRRVFSCINKLIKDNKDTITIDEYLLNGYVATRLGLYEKDSVPYAELLAGLYNSAMGAFKIQNELLLTDLNRINMKGSNFYKR